jgi:hypothetical protein
MPTYTRELVAHANSEAELEGLLRPVELALKVLGRGALVLGALSLSAVGWMLALIGYAIALAMLAQRFGWWLGRRLRPRRSALSPAM